ncbi:arylesterase [Cyclobacterium marinum]|uniref:Lipolytic protein G-D-S-L family n=1 Tax=Cyclobacterium marinum (strain ATCC 25205 / DSM 745 / LMG 13164 / NCIMB 1802) TaxID=880070 RepID=G0IW62_CYCMS|nr:arylesterase [Cyclobacterium marinum]AEL26282.1 lipolytic protein G-D-S-L family [Cyclobacterium marinum DSM 745]MBR9774358.1 arylesterase [Cytophagales bacterium]
MLKLIKTIFPVMLLLVAISFFTVSCNQKQESEKKVTPTADKKPEKQKKKNILFYGNSLTAGYGLDEDESFPSLIQNKIDSLNLNYRVINGGLSGETTASGLSRLDWFLEDQPEVFILELGGNDGLRGIPLAETRKNLNAIISSVSNRFPDTKILLAGMQIPPNMGQEYSEEFREMYAEIARKQEVEMIPFLLEGVAGNPDLNLPDGIHPTSEGQEIVAQTVWKHLRPLL